jgi:hypothetical protein
MKKELLERYNGFSNEFLKKVLFSEDETYTTVAKQCALEVLEKRNPNIKQELEEQKNNLSQNPTLNEEQLKSTNSNTIPLFAKELTSLFAVIFTPIHGLTLLLINANKLKKSSKPIYLTGLIYLSIVFIIPFDQPGISRTLPLLLNISFAYIISNYLWKKVMGDIIIEKKQDWIRPFIVSVITIVPFIYSVIKNDL